MQLPKYGIPKSTLHLYEIGKIELEARPGPLSILTTVISLRMLKAVPPVTVVGVTIVLSVAFLYQNPVGCMRFFSFMVATVDLTMQLTFFRIAPLS